jgi:hypothetical protein
MRLNPPRGPGIGKPSRYSTLARLTEQPLESYKRHL